MAKRKVVREQMETIEEQFTSPSSGVTVTLVPIAYYKIQGISTRLEREFRERGEPIDVPTFEVEVAGGDKQKHEHYHVVEIEDGQEVVVKSSLKTDEDHAAWRAHLAALNQMQNAAIEPTMRLALTDGVQFEMPEDDKWISRQKFQGLDVPEEETEREFHYVLTEVLRTPEEQKEVVKRIVILSVANRDPETEEAIAALFRG